MSYESESILPNTVTLSQVRDIVELLGYRKFKDKFKIANRIASYYWYEEEDYRSYVGIELSIYKEPRHKMKIYTRSRSGRSYWELIQQNKTLKLIRDLLGGDFTTDAGRNRYWRPDEPPPTPLASGCFLARWRFHNDLIKARVYIDNTQFRGDIAKTASSGLEFMDEINPRLLSNNLLLPYLIAIWEEYFRSTFTAALKFSKQREAALRRARLSQSGLDQVARGLRSIERIVAESLSFQRPTAIADNFHLLDGKLDIGAALRKPYRRRRQSLFDSIEKLVEDRNEFVHVGRMSLELFDPQLKSALSDMEVAINRAYECVAAHYRFVPSHDY